MDGSPVGVGPLDQPLGEVSPVCLGVVLRLRPPDGGIPTVRDDRRGPCPFERDMGRVGVVACRLGVSAESVDEQEQFRRVVERPRALGLESWSVRCVEEPARSDDGCESGALYPPESPCNDQYT